MFVGLTGQPNFKLQLILYCDFKKRTDTKLKQNDLFSSLKLNYIIFQSELESTVIKTKNNIQAKLENQQIKISAEVFEKITP